jgi:hypothetical protein
MTDEERLDWLREVAGRKGMISNIDARSVLRIVNDITARLEAAEAALRDIADTWETSDVEWVDDAEEAAAYASKARAALNPPATEPTASTRAAGR